LLLCKLLRQLSETLALCHRIRLSRRLLMVSLIRSRGVRVRMVVLVVVEELKNGLGYEVVRTVGH